jgi:hypothetical protein
VTYSAFYVNQFDLVTSIWIGQQGWLMTMPGRGWMDSK